MAVFGTERALEESQITTDLLLKIRNQKERIHESLRDRRFFSKEELELLNEVCAEIVELQILAVYSMYASGLTAKEIMAKSTLPNARVNLLVKEFRNTAII